MKLSWLFVILLLIFVAVFSVQNAGVIMVQFLTWEMQVSAALVILLAALLGGLVGLGFGAWSGRGPKPVGTYSKSSTTAPVSPTTSPAAPAPARTAPVTSSSPSTPAKPIGSSAGMPSGEAPIVVPPAREEKR